MNKYMSWRGIWATVFNYSTLCTESIILSIKVVLTEEADSSILGILNDAVPEAERNFANDMISVQLSVITVNRENVDASFDKGIFLL